MIITLEELNNIILDEKTFIVVGVGGAGNYIGCMLRGILFYKLCNFDKTHKLIILSRPMYNGDFVITDIFEDNDNIYFYNCNLSNGTHDINFSTNGLDINNFIDQRATIDLPFKEILLNKNIDISKLKNYSSLTYNTNSLYIPPNKLNYCKELLKDFNIHIKSHIKKQINDFLKEHKIGGDGYSIGVHFRCTDARGSRFDYNTNFNKNFLELDKILRTDTNIKNIFICSDEECVEDNIKKRYANNYNCISFKKNSKVRKIPSLENYDWFINKESDIKEIKDKELNNVPGWCIQSHNMYEYIYNTWRDKYQVIDGIIDTIIFNSCSKHYTNTPSASSLATLGDLLIHLKCFIYE